MRLIKIVVCNCEVDCCMQIVLWHVCAVLRSSYRTDITNISRKGESLLFKSRKCELKLIDDEVEEFSSEVEVMPREVLCEASRKLEVIRHMMFGTA